MLSNPTQLPSDKRAFRIPEFCRAFGIGRSKFYELVARRELRPRKSGKQTLIPVGEAERWFNSLPILEPETRPRHRPSHRHSR
jgi:predicted DNA-binding transcriptional regulator AlpA